jgi:hypothetical protein
MLFDLAGALAVPVALNTSAMASTPLEIKRLKIRLVYLRLELPSLNNFEKPDQGFSPGADPAFHV